MCKEKRIESHDVNLLIIVALLAFIPANIAKNKGYRFGLWWLYGWFFFVIALIHIALLPNKNAQQNNLKNPQSSADELKKYKDLLDQGAITQAEYQAKKEQLLYK